MANVSVALNRVKLSNGEILAYREREGGSHPIVFVHGNMTSSKHWDLVIDEMDAKYKVYAVDLRGFGESSYNQRINGIKDFSDDLYLWTRELGLKNVDLVGWSTGGAVGMQFVADYPGLCRKLILQSSASTRGYPFFATGEDGLPNVNKRLETIEEVENDPGKTVAVQTAYNTNNRDVLKAIWNALIYTHNQPNHALYEEYVDDMRTQRNLADVYQALNIFNISNQHNGLVEGTDLAKKISVPVLVLQGDRDYVVSSRMAEEIIEDIGTNARLETLVDCGHSPVIDDVTQLVQKITSFLEE